MWFSQSFLLGVLMLLLVLLIHLQLRDPALPERNRRLNRKFGRLILVLALLEIAITIFFYAYLPPAKRVFFPNFQRLSYVDDVYMGMLVVLALVAAGTAITCLLYSRRLAKLRHPRSSPSA